MSGYYAGLAREFRPSTDDLRTDAAGLPWWFRTWCPDFDARQGAPGPTPVARTLALADALGWREVSVTTDGGQRSRLIDRIRGWFRRAG